MTSINLSPNNVGQLAVGLMVNPPQPGDPSYALYEEEKLGILESLKRRAAMIVDAFNRLEGVSCQTTQGALYAFPKIELPPKSIAAAERAGKSPDLFYCLELLLATGICCVPGSGFGQVPGTFHLRTTILPPEETFQEITEKFSAFHSDFMRCVFCFEYFERDEADSV